MEENKFFKFIWRVNALVIFGAASGVLITLVCLAVTLAYDAFFRDQNNYTGALSANITQSIERENGEKEKMEELFFKNATPIAGTDYYRLTLETKRDYSHYKSIKLNGNFTRNHLFLHNTNGQSHWLLPDNKSHILKVVGIKPYDDANKEHNSRYLGTDVDAYVYGILSKDTNEDDVLDSKDKRTLSISNKIGKNYTVLDENIDQVMSAQALKGRRLSILYKKDQSFFTLVLAKSNFKVLSKKEMNFGTTDEPKEE
jgi:hypothetical protein